MHHFKKVHSRVSSKRASKPICVVNCGKERHTHSTAENREQGAGSQVKFLLSTQIQKKPPFSVWCAGSSRRRPQAKRRRRISSFSFC